MSTVLRFERMPPMGLYRAAMPRRVHFSGAMPAISAELAEVPLSMDPR